MTFALWLLPWLVRALLVNRHTAQGVFFYEGGPSRPVSWTDYLYTMLLGLGMLFSAAAAVREIVQRTG